MAFVLVWARKGEGDKNFEIFRDRKSAELAAVDHRRAGDEAYVVSGDLPAAEGLDPSNPDHMLGGFKA